MSAQQPTERPQPPKAEGYRHGTAAPSSNLKPTITMSPRYTLPTSKAGTPLNSAPGTPTANLSSLSLSTATGYPLPVPPRGPIRMLSEHAVSDTPLTSDPYGTPSAASAGGDYLSYHRPTNAQSQLPTAELRSNLAATAATAAMGASGAGAWGSSRGIIGGSGPANPREARETQYVSSASSLSAAGSRNNSSTALSGMVSGHTASRGHPLASRENLQQSEAKTEGEQMAPYGEGEVARAVEGQARRRNTKRRESMAQGEKPNLSLAQLGEGEKEGEGESDHHGRRERMGSASQREASGERHGRVRGEVSLEPSEADLER